MRNYKITRRLKPVIVGRKVKRVGAPYYDVAYLTDNWHYKEFETLAQAKEFVGKS